ncbi:hypothetical protein AKJ50_00435 [candidate division MSBL1 archaeon SCGC-AAA382A13]|uniref:Uncharacterized protein n=1 Tax=candidate division MSBL1 archaeon SCGC-AAA382A13 TaxID=1698279 RepID=A0A133VGQ7_9EURY|nr:hypothetical protein AKJ50_00435 [candidate division MSBL1 archaeon SCGC-AAA382A13]
MIKNDKFFSVRAKSLGDLIVTEECPHCGRVHKWIWPNHPEIGNKGTKNCGGKKLIVEIIPNSEYQEPSGGDVGEKIENLFKKAENGDKKAQKRLKRIYGRS